jgi:glycogen debranching enzyme
VADWEDGHVILTFTEWHTLVGMAPKHLLISVEKERNGGEVSPDVSKLGSNPELGSEVAFFRRPDGQFSLSFGRTMEEAENRAQQGLEVNVRQAAERHLQAYDLLPELSANQVEQHSGRMRLLNKCYSIMRVNTLSKEGAIQQRWSTPNRVPHRYMWLWDSAFHSFGMNDAHPDAAWDFLRSMLEMRQDDGLIPITAVWTGEFVSVTQPPLLAWAVWNNYLRNKRRENLAYAFPILEKYLAWDLANRDVNENGLLEWKIEMDTNCRSGESGADNSPRFDSGEQLDVVDFSVFAANDMFYTALIAEELGEPERAETWRSRSQCMSSAIHQLLWNEEDGFYYDRKFNGEHSNVKAVSGFLPLLLPDLPAERVDRLISALHDPSQFGSAIPVPSVSLSNPAYSTDMWRGPTWINMNYLIVIGLTRQGRLEEAQRLKERTIALVDKYYKQYGVLFEYYDSSDHTPPVRCDRKGPFREPYDIRQKVNVIRDYHWTAALTFSLLVEGYRIT